MYFADITMYQMGIDNPSKALTMDGPQSYELAQPLKSLNNKSGHSQHQSSYSTRQLRYMQGSQRRRGDNWFNDSFEDEGDREERYATRPRLPTNASSSADTAKPQESTLKEPGGATTEENIYDIPDEVLENYSKAKLQGGKAGVYECPKDTNDDIYDEIITNTAVGGLHEGDSADIYDDIITNKAVVNMGGLHEGDSSYPADIYDDITTNTAVVNMGGLHAGDSATANPADIYEEVETKAADIYEAGDQSSHDGSEIEVYDTFQ